VIEDLSNPGELFEDFKTNIKTDIRKAVKSGLRVIDTLSIEDFYAVHQKTFQRQSMEVSYDKNFVLNIEKTLGARNARKMFFAVDDRDRIHAAAYIVYDAHCAYYFMGGGDPELRSSGATSLVIGEAITFAATVSRKFNFEGSAVPAIERFFRAFGGSQKIYYIIHKSSTATRIALNILRKQKNFLFRFRKLP
jgi:lipid II:glycine glycyltransferase (peptidoglycan interpeptide bridge formation enzyme)